jgi:hypothetical protein
VNDGGLPDSGLADDHRVSPCGQKLVDTSQCIVDAKRARKSTRGSGGREIDIDPRGESLAYILSGHEYSWS